MLRSLLEKLSRGIVLKKRLPAEFGRRPIFVSPEGGGLRYWKPKLDNIDNMLTQVVRQFLKPGHIVWDVGGNMGFLSFTAAVQVGPTGQVAVFEPDLFLAHLLRKTANANPDLNVDIFATAISNKDGVAQFNIAERARTTNYLAEASGSTQTGGVRQTLAVPTLCLDTFIERYPAPHFLKIDVEGAEHLVFGGMKKMLQTVRPIILYEVLNENKAYIRQLLQESNYKMYCAGKLPDLMAESPESDNIIAIPS